MKIGIISPYALPEKGAASMRVDNFQKYFISKGYNTKIIAPFRSKEIETKSSLRYKDSSELRKISLEFDYIIITCPSFYTAFRIIPFLKFNRIPFLLDIRDLAENTTRKANLIFQLISIGLSKKISTVTETMKNHISKKYFVNEKKISVVSNGSDSKIFYPGEDSEKIRRRFNIQKNEKLIVYEGIIGDHGLGEFLNNLDYKFLEKNRIKILLLLIVGETENKTKFILDDFMKTIKKNKLDKFLSIVKNSPLENLRNYISAGDFGLAPIPSDKKNLYRVPIKVYDYIACGVPILAKGPIDGELEKLVKNYNCGYFFSNWNSLIKNLDKLNKNKLNKNLYKNFDRKNFSKKLLDFLIE